MSLTPLCTRYREALQSISDCAPLEPPMGKALADYPENREGIIARENDAYAAGKYDQARRARAGLKLGPS